MMPLLKEIGLAGWIRVGVSDSGSGDLGVISIAPTSSIYVFSSFRDNLEQKLGFRLKPQNKILIFGNEEEMDKERANQLVEII